MKPVLTVLWRRAPFILATRFVQIFIAITAAALILSAIAASGELFLASNETASLSREIDGSTSLQAGLRVNAVAYVQGDEETLDGMLNRFQPLLEEDVSTIGHLGPPVVTIMGRDLTAESSSGTEGPVRLIERSGAGENVEAARGRNRRRRMDRRRQRTTAGRGAR